MMGGSVSAMASHACVIARLKPPLAAQIWQLRQSLQLPGASGEPHLTILPPIPHDPSEDDVVVARVRCVARAFAPFRLQVAGAATFAPQTPVVYSEVTGDLVAIHALHRALANGHSARDFRYPYIPHVTLAWAETSEQAHALTRAVKAANFRGRCELDELEVVVGQLPDRWQTLARIKLRQTPHADASSSA